MHYIYSGLANNHFVIRLSLTGTLAAARSILALSVQFLWRKVQYIIRYNFVLRLTLEAARSILALSVQFLWREVRWSFSMSFPSSSSFSGEISVQETANWSLHLHLIRIIRIFHLIGQWYLYLFKFTQNSPKFTTQFKMVFYFQHSASNELFMSILYIKLWTSIKRFWFKCVQSDIVTYQIWFYCVNMVDQRTNESKSQSIFSSL